MTPVDFNLISVNLAEQIDREMLGTPSEGRVVIAVNSSDKKTQSGLFIPNSAAQEEFSYRGVVVRKGPSTEDGSPTHESVNVGDVIHYGKYGGKEIFPSFYDPIPGTEDLKYFVLSSTEIIFVEPNTNAEPANPNE